MVFILKINCVFIISAEITSERNLKPTSLSWRTLYLKNNNVKETTKVKQTVVVTASEFSVHCKIMYTNTNTGMVSTEAITMRGRGGESTYALWHLVPKTLKQTMVVYAVAQWNDSTMDKWRERLNDKNIHAHIIIAQFHDIFLLTSFIHWKSFTQGYHWRFPRMILTFLEEKWNVCLVKDKKGEKILSDFTRCHDWNELVIQGLTWAEKRAGWHISILNSLSQHRGWKTTLTLFRVSEALHI